MPVTILEGSTFCLSDEVGDLDGQGYGFFAEDTRFLSRFTLTINGVRPLLLSSGKVEYFSAAFYTRNPPVGVDARANCGIAEVDSRRCSSAPDSTCRPISSGLMSP